MTGPIFRDENGKSFRWRSNGEREYFDAQPIASRGGLLAILIFSIVVGGLIAIFIAHAVHVPLPRVHWGTDVPPVLRTAGH